MVEKKAVQTAVESALQDGKGKRKFVQSVDLAVNFKDLDFKKPENRINVDVVMPHSPRENKIAVFADGQMALDAKNGGAELVIGGTEIASYAADKAKQAKLLECGAVLAATPLMAQVGKALGQVLSAKGRLPKPIMPNADVKNVISSARRTISVRSKGKYLPCVHCIIGKENVPAGDIADNVLAVLEAIERKVPEQNISGIFVKTTMGKSFKAGV